MKTTIRNISACLMMVILFAVSSGFNLFSHICLMGGEQEISALEIQSCCTHEPIKQTNEIKPACCDDDVQFIRLELRTIVYKQQVQHDVLTAIVCDIPQFNTSEKLNNRSLTFDHLPPPKTGRDILSQNQVFRI